MNETHVPSGCLTPIAQTSPLSQASEGPESGTAPASPPASLAALVADTQDPLPSQRPAGHSVPLGRLTYVQAPARKSMAPGSVQPFDSGHSGWLTFDATAGPVAGGVPTGWQL